jgi:hypothetical protein
VVGGAIHEVAAHLLTSDGDPHAIATVPAAGLPEGSVMQVEATCLGMGPASGVPRGFYHIEGSFYRLAGGNVTQQGATGMLNSAETDPELDAGFEVDTVTQQVKVLVTGLDPLDVHWVTGIKTVVYEP